LCYLWGKLRVGARHDLYGQAESSQDLTFSYIQLLNPLQGGAIVDRQLTITLITLSGREGGVLASSLYSGQVKTLSDLFSYVQFCSSLT
jgi:hypothetical protein